jgi:valyl-tRNA synthetase
MWCVKDTSGIGNPESEEREEESYLNYIEFEISGSKGKTLTIATTRPEMLHACVAVAINPKDDRFEGLAGKKIKIPIFDLTVELITDENVDPTFGTGAEMVCTFGDKADIEMYIKHRLKYIEAMDEKGILKNAGSFTGLYVDKARDAIIDELRKQKLLLKQEKIKHTVKVHDRCNTRIEYIMAKQWFLKIKEHSDKIKQLANEIKWYPDFTKQRLYDWANFIEWDWNITRNRIFGTPMPFWSCQKCDYIIAPNEKDLPIDTSKKKPETDKCPKCDGKIIGTMETIDNWVDSSITPLIIAGWPDNKKMLEKAFPNSVRIQGTDIIRTWAFYTIYRSYFVGGNKPFENIIVHGMILGIDGKEMHKRFGNGIYLNNLIPKYSVDTVRLWVALSGGIGKDKAFSYAEMDYAKSFINKLYNSANFVNMALEKGKVPREEPHKNLNIFDIWILNRLNEVTKEVTEAYDEFTLYAAMSNAINFYWHEFADYYIENVKHRVYSEDKKMYDSKGAALFTLKHVLDTSLKFFAPVIPFVCEEINSTDSKRSIFDEKFPTFTEKIPSNSYSINGLVFKSAVVDVDYANSGAFLNAIISDVRKAKAKEKKALNYEITSININVPEEYYKVTLSSKEELMQICKAKKVEISKGKYSIDVKI